MPQLSGRAARTAELLRLLGEDNVRALRVHYKIVIWAAATTFLGCLLMLVEVTIRYWPLFWIWVVYTSVTLVPLFIGGMVWDWFMYRALARYLGISGWRIWSIPLQKPAELDDWIRSHTYQPRSGPRPE